MRILKLEVDDNHWFEISPDGCNWALSEFTKYQGVSKKTGKEGNVLRKQTSYHGRISACMAFVYDRILKGNCDDQIDGIRDICRLLKVNMKKIEQIGEELQRQIEENKNEKSSKSELLLLKSGDMENKTVAELLYILKLEFDVSEYEVSKRIGKSPSTVNQWKHENSNQKMFYFIYLGVSKQLRMERDLYPFNFDENEDDDNG